MNMKLNQIKYFALTIVFWILGCTNQTDKALSQTVNTYNNLPNELKEHYTEYLKSGNLESQINYFTELFYFYCEIDENNKQAFNKIPHYLIYINKFNDLKEVYKQAYPEVRNLKIGNYRSEFEINDQQFQTAKKHIHNNDEQTKEYLKSLRNAFSRSKSTAGSIEVKFRHFRHKNKLKAKDQLIGALKEKRFRLTLDEACKTLLRLIKDQNKI